MCPLKSKKDLLKHLVLLYTIAKCMYFRLAFILMPVLPHCPRKSIITLIMTVIHHDTRNVAKHDYPGW